MVELGEMASRSALSVVYYCVCYLRRRRDGESGFRAFARPCARENRLTLGRAPDHHICGVPRVPGSEMALGHVDRCPAPLAVAFGGSRGEPGAKPNSPPHPSLSPPPV